jgi:hypothetical protein
VGKFQSSKVQQGSRVILDSLRLFVKELTMIGQV